MHSNETASQKLSLRFVKRTSELCSTRPIYLNFQVLNWKIIIAIVIAMYFHLILFYCSFFLFSLSLARLPSTVFRLKSNLYSSLFRFFAFFFFHLYSFFREWSLWIDSMCCSPPVFIVIQLLALALLPLLLCVVFFLRACIFIGCTCLGREKFSFRKSANLFCFLANESDELKPNTSKAMARKNESRHRDNIQNEKLHTTNVERISKRRIIADEKKHKKRSTFRNISKSSRMGLKVKWKTQQKCLKIH